MRANLEGLNAGYVAQLFEDYLDSPGSVPSEWRAAFENDDAILDLLPGLRTLLAARHERRPARCSATATCPRGSYGRSRRRQSVVDETLLGGVAAAMALVKAYRMHGHLAARLDPLGSEPTGDPALDESRRTRAHAQSCRRGSPPGCCGCTSKATPCSRRCRGCARSTAARSPTRSSTSPTTPSASGCAKRSSRDMFRNRSRRRGKCVAPPPVAGRGPQSNTCASRSRGVAPRAFRLLGDAARLAAFLGQQQETRTPAA